MDCQMGYLKNEENCNFSKNTIWDPKINKCTTYYKIDAPKMCDCTEIGCEAVNFY